MEPIDVEEVMKQLTMPEKILLLSGEGIWNTQGLDRLNIPKLNLNDGPHGVRPCFFNGPPGIMLPTSTAMAATFDKDLINKVGEYVAYDAREKGVHCLLGPVVCLQRSPLIGRGFEAFSEDPYLSGILAASYIDGTQSHGVGCSLKHYAAHDRSSSSPRDDVIATERTLRETSLLPFHLAVKHSDPWSIMTAYNKINGIHASEDPWLLKKVLREDWGWKGVVISDWWGTYSVAESLNAGLDLEMPGPSLFRDELLGLVMRSDKITLKTVDSSVRNYLNFVRRVQTNYSPIPVDKKGDTQEKRALCRKVASDSVVLLKNEKNILPLDPRTDKSIGLIGSAFEHPCLMGGGSGEAKPYYVVTPLDAFLEVLGQDRIKTAIGAHAHIFSPLLHDDVYIPGTDDKGYILEFFSEDPMAVPGQTPIATLTTDEAQMYFADNLPEEVPSAYWLRVRTCFKPRQERTLELGFSVIGKGKLYLDGTEKIDLFNSKPEKTIQTPVFNQLSVEVLTGINVAKGNAYDICALLHHEGPTHGMGSRSKGGLRIGCREKIDPAVALEEAVALAKSVDVPIIMTGLNADWESEACDRQDLNLPAGVDTLIEKVVEANPNTIVITQAGTPIVMPWVDECHTLLHAWYGGMETGHGITDVLFGQTNPSGRLSITFPKRLEDTPAFLSSDPRNKKVFYGEGVFIGHRYHEKLNVPPLFYFGYGLSYTTFEYSNFQAPARISLDKDNTFEVLVDVTNTGALDGMEVVQMWVADKESSNPRPLKEFKGFTKVYIEAGQTVTARVELDKFALSFWHDSQGQWIAEKGDFDLIISQSADPKDEVLRKPLFLESDFLWSDI